MLEADSRGEQEAFCSQAVAGSQRAAAFQDAQPAGSGVFIEGAPCTAAQSVTRGFELGAARVDINYAVLAKDAPGTNEEKAAARSAELERVGEEA